jgi:methyltransferase
MVTNIAFWIVVAVAIQRLGELLLAHRNTKRLLADGAREIGAAHYPFIVAVHGGWLMALLVGAPSVDLVNWWLIAGFGLFQCGRVWVLSSLGPYWTTRIITIPGAPLVRTGPYRWLRHPNYVIVAGEIMLLPLAFGMVEVAIGFSVANAMVLFWRIRIENDALFSRQNN